MFALFKVPSVIASLGEVITVSLTCSFNKLPNKNVDNIGEKIKNKAKIIYIVLE